MNVPHWSLLQKQYCLLSCEVQAFDKGEFNFYLQVAAILIVTFPVSEHVIHRRERICKEGAGLCGLSKNALDGCLECRRHLPLPLFQTLSLMP
jgi:hypothetical protein